MRLVLNEQSRQWDSRGHFFAAAAEGMRRILVDAARRKNAEKRSGEWVRHDVHLVDAAIPETPEDLVALDDALERLATVDKQAAELVHLRFFAGLSLAQAGEMLGISSRSADRLWSYARAWLHQEMQGGESAQK
jgi:RNA polymerase sigma factor (TIGR02999 family)